MIFHSTQLSFTNHIHCFIKFNLWNANLYKNNNKNNTDQNKIWNMLYDFQKDAVLAIIYKLEKYNGCILADSVGLGKTFTALAVVKYYENRNKTVLVLCPKKLDAYKLLSDDYDLGRRIYIVQ